MDMSVFQKCSIAELVIFNTLMCCAVILSMWMKYIGYFYVSIFFLKMLWFVVQLLFAYYPFVLEIILFYFYLFTMFKPKIQEYVCKILFCYCNIEV